MRSTLALLLGLVPALSAPALADDPRIFSTERLLSQSSLVRKIEQSDSAAAKQKLEQARGHLNAARTASRSGDIQGTKEQLDLANRNAFEAARMVSGDEILAKAKADFERQMESVFALRTAYLTVAAENPAVDTHGLENQTERRLERAGAAAGKADYKSARHSLDEAYRDLRTGLEELRNGQTLVRSLDFVTPADEFAYYQEKIQSQQQAIAVLVQRVEQPGTRKMIESITQGAQGMVRDAQGLASHGDYDKAIPILDKALTRLQSGLMMVIR